MSARILAVTNQKGGSGKTTTSMTLAAGFSKMGFRTLVVDGDPQGSATRWYAMSPEENPFPAPVVNLAEARGKIGQALRDHVESYDIIVIDCPPNLDSPVMLSVLFVADLAIAPVVPSAIDTWATEKLLRVVEMAQAHNPALQVWTLLNMVRNTALARDMSADLADDENLNLLETMFTLRTSFQEAAALGVSVFERGDRRAIGEAKKLCEEALHLMGLEAKSPSPAARKSVSGNTSKSKPKAKSVSKSTQAKVKSSSTPRSSALDEIGPAKALPRRKSAANGAAMAG